MRRGALPEVAGDAAVFASEVSAEALADSIRSVLGSGDLRADLRRKGLARAEAFRWRDIAKRTLDVVRAAARD
jgi:glycosyltransferase involved in cell wall biosynthesis